jgi:hypothetical protein
LITILIIFYNFSKFFVFQNLCFSRKLGKGNIEVAGGREGVSEGGSVDFCGFQKKKFWQFKFALNMM